MSNKFSHIKLQDFFDRDPDKFEPNPRKAWAAIFFLEIILIVFVLAAHIYLYNHTRTDTSYKTGADSAGRSEAKLNRKGLAGIMAMFEAKSVQFQKLIESSPQIADPSEFAPAPASSKAVVSPIATSTTPAA
jgi:hypothetical protein